MTKKDVFETVNNRIIEAIEAGTNPWRKPWIGKKAPFNIQTGKKYSVLNQLCLTRPGAYATFNQWKAMGGSIKKGSKAEQICFWTIYKKTTEEDGQMKEEKIPVLKTYNVFNIDDVTFKEGKTPKKVQDYLASLGESGGLSFEHERHAKAEEILNAYVQREGITLNECPSDRAFYSPTNDCVQIPELSQFPNVSEYYSTKAHELVHSTGHEKRLKRDFGKKFGSEKYSREELVAEIGSACFLNF